MIIFSAVLSPPLGEGGKHGHAIGSVCPGGRSILVARSATTYGGSVGRLHSIIWNSSGDRRGDGHILHEALDKKLVRGNCTEQDTDATFEGAVLRLRPKLMTVAVALLGLIPIMWSHSTGADV